MNADDIIAPFQIEGAPVRGRIVRLGETVRQILGAHAYPAPVANLLGEACALAALVGAGLKMDGRLILQAQGDGPVSLVAADYDSSGSLRGYCRFDADRVAEAAAGFGGAGAGRLLGRGLLVMTLDQGEDMDRYQGVVEIGGESLALAAETYFTRSEQTPTRVRLAVATQDGLWRAGGLMLQRLAADDARGAADAEWDEAQALFETLGEDELLDPELGHETLLWRVFHERGVRAFAARPLAARCRCSEASVMAMLRAFPPGERAAMIEADGRIRVTCEYCARVYEVAPETVA